MNFPTFLLYLKFTDFFSVSKGKYTDFAIAFKDFKTKMVENKSFIRMWQ